MIWGDPAGGRATTAGVDFNWRRSDLEDGARLRAMHGLSSPTTKTLWWCWRQVVVPSDTFSIRGG